MAINLEAAKQKAARLAAIESGEIPRPAPPPPVAEAPRKQYRDASALVSRNYDVEVFFTEEYTAKTGISSQVCKVHATSPFAALRTASYTPCEEWEADALLAVTHAIVRKP